ncbi:MAG: ABC transporter ATP-binding protein [Synechococcales cyanobacterium RM1_1_8]|nr:ABC transporter ATP-binding protein [Synechococcales cyanobacterium RM1_1_8]
MALAAHDLALAYEGKPIIEGLNLAIPAGKITVLVGPNGCGKSTLLKGLGRLLKPKQGTVYLDGSSIFKLPTKLVAQQLGLLPQGPTAPEGLTVTELIAQGRYPYQSWLQQWSEEDEKKVNAALEITSLTSFAHRPIDSLSGGQRQRAWIAMTLAQDTPVLLLDEPTTFLDLAHQIEVLDLLYDLNQQEGRTIIMVLHELNQAGRYGDRMIAMKAGKVYAQGSPREVMTEPLVKDIFGLDCRVVEDPVSGTPLCIPMGRKSDR